MYEEGINLAARQLTKTKEWATPREREKGERLAFS